MCAAVDPAISLSTWASTVASSPDSRRPLPRPRHPPPPWCSWRGLVNMVNERHPSAMDCTRKIMIPPPDSWDPPKGPLYFAKKMFPPLTCRTHQLYLRTQGSASLLRTKNEYPLLAGTHHSGRMTCGPTKLMGTEGFVNIVNMNDSSSSDRTMSIQQL